MLMTTLRGRLILFVIDDDADDADPDGADGADGADADDAAEGDLDARLIVIRGRPGAVSEDQHQHRGHPSPPG